jgi:hypothetical protein
MPQIRVPRLCLNRCGVYCFRLKTAVLDKRFSLGTKCPRTAIMLALHLERLDDLLRRVVQDMA